MAGSPAATRRIVRTIVSAAQLREVPGRALRSAVAWWDWWSNAVRITNRLWLPDFAQELQPVVAAPEHYVAQHDLWLEVPDQGVAVIEAVRDPYHIDVVLRPNERGERLCVAG